MSSNIYHPLNPLNPYAIDYTPNNKQQILVDSNNCNNQTKEMDQNSLIGGIGLMVCLLIVVVLYIQVKGFLEAIK